ncbi:zinc finger, CCHC-type containing protein [Tanacetum coccineum]|uniref:Zinc finger, CCHC-type containing protein n=1 Tax=Tanacetum coccineum TaxID=301880 RepID=A0ABQ5HU18_9ASTR
MSSHLLGYSEHSKSFWLYVIESNESVSINSILKSRDGIFNKNRFYLVPKPSIRIPNGTEDIGGSVVPEEVTKELYLIEGARDEKEAINDEMDSIMGNNTWVLADMPLGIDYLDTYALVAHINTIRLLIALALVYSLIIHQMDVKTTFLNDELDDEVYMNQPQGFNMPGNEKKVDLTKEFLSSRFAIKDMGEADVILDIRIKMKAVSQLEVIGCLMYAITCTRPNIAFLVGKLSRYTSNPSTQHWQAIQWVLKYLKKIMNYSLPYICYPYVLELYTDVSCINNTKDNSSTSGWVFLLNGGAISWVSKKQTCITSSIMESQFMALVVAGKEAECVATLAKAYSQMYNGKSRHLGVKHNIIREVIMNGVVSIEFVRSQQNLVDHLTKGLARDLVL